MSTKKPPTYTPMPEVPEPMRERFATMLAVQSGAMTVSEGARKLGMARNHFQSLLNRGMAAMLEGVTPKAPGRPAKPEQEVKLLQENEKLRRENEKLKAQVDNTHKMVELVADVFNKRIARVTGTREPRPKKSLAETPDDPEEDLRDVTDLRSAGLLAVLAAAVVGSSPSTVRRWRARQRQGLLLRDTRGPSCAAPPSAQLVQKVDAVVRELNGIIGADSLREAVPGVSRRQAASIKRVTVTAMERERIAACERVHITTPGVVRGMDAMYEMTTDGWRWLLLFGDSCVPYRTSALITDAYDSPAVLRAINDDFAQNGAPLVLRIDRASCHRTPEVRELLARHGVLLLHGPPRHPGFYGQQERQNRDNRAWLAALGVPTPANLQAQLPRMLRALNERWPKRKLGFKTAGECWNAKPVIVVDRQELRREVERNEEQLRRRNVSVDLAQRLAIEKALTNRGWLHREAGGWC